MKNSVVKRNLKIIEYRCYKEFKDNEFINKVMSLQIKTQYEIIRNKKNNRRYVYKDIGFQAHLAYLIEKKLEEKFENANSQNSYEFVSLKHKTDVFIPYNNFDYFVEIEFRPNLEKDIVKFQMKYNEYQNSNNNNFVAVLILAKTKKNINPSYSSMTQYENALKIIDKYNPQFKLIVFCIDLIDDN